MSGEFPNAQKPTRGQFCLVNVSVKKDQNGTISDLGIRQRAAAPTTHELTSSDSDSSPGNNSNWIFTIANCGVRPSSKYSNSHTGSASSNAAKSSVVPALAIVPRYTIAHPGARSSATRRGVSGETRGVHRRSMVDRACHWKGPLERLCVVSQAILAVSANFISYQSSIAGE